MRDSNEVERISGIQGRENVTGPVWCKDNSVDGNPGSPDMCHKQILRKVMWRKNLDAKREKPKRAEGISIPGS